MTLSSNRLPGRQARDRRPVGANPKQQLAGNLLLRMKTLLETSWPPTMPPGATEPPDPGSVTRMAASQDADTTDLLVGDVLRANQSQERR